MNKEKVIIYTDGACKGNPGIGGYGAILKYKDKIKEVSGFELNTTNNRMELTAVIEGLKSLNRSCQIEIYTDSQYVQKGITQWIFTWKAKNWSKVKNVDLWQALDEQASKHQIDWHWVKGHNGDVMNEKADALANLAITQAIS
jgi:ribonuclease HI